MRLLYVLLISGLVAAPAIAQPTDDAGRAASLFAGATVGGDLIGVIREQRAPKITSAPRVTVTKEASPPQIPPAPPPANATTYTYDALGRLVQSDVTTDGATVTTKIQYDPAGNRTSYTVTGANRAGNDTGDDPAVMRPTGIVVVPLNGFTIIPLDADS